MALRVNLRMISLLGFLAALGLGPTSAGAGPFAEPGVPASAVLEWTNAVVALARGPENLADPASPLASFGAPESALGPTGSETLDTVALGDGGEIVLEVEGGIGDGPGPDLAVFENGFWTLGGLFAELAFVEVSTDGERFVRFPSVSWTPGPLAGFDPLDPTDVHGLAGRHPAGEGTGFDLAELADAPPVLAGDVDLSQIFFVRIRDVVGDGSTTDRDGMPVYDPFPTPFASGGFDLDAVGVLNLAPEPRAAALWLASLAALAALGRARRPRAGNRLPALAWSIAVLAGAAWLAPTPAAAVTVDFEDLDLAPESAFVGANGAGGFTSRGVRFNNEFTDFGGGFSAWRGFGHSNRTDRSSPGPAGGTSAFAGGGANGSATYGVASGSDPDFATITLPTPQVVSGAHLTNTTFSALSMRQGDAFAKKFGGPDGTDPDFFSVTITGRDAGDAALGSVELFLADFRFANDALDFVLDRWTFVDLSGLGPVSSLTFSLASSDVGEFGLNTPATFAIDDLVVAPEPGTGWLLVVGLGGVWIRVRRRR